MTSSSPSPSPSLSLPFFPSLHNKRILVTGGNGYIGSHTVLALLASGSRVTIVDNLSNSSWTCFERVKQIASKGTERERAALQFLKLFPLDLRQTEEVEKQVFVPSFQEARQHHLEGAFDACVHFAALKAVGESVEKPLDYYHCNVWGCIALLKLLERYECRNVVFSSSATVYGEVTHNPITESAALSTTNPYGSTKLVIENMLRELCAIPKSKASAPWRVALLRYFNPIGAHSSGLIGEDPAGIPNNLLPFVLQVAIGKRDKVVVHGDDWPTQDGTGVRDYIHITDLAIGHLAALANAIFEPKNMDNNCEAYNLGTGRGSSVLEVIAATEKACGHPIKYEVGSRRPGDIAECYADPSKAKEKLNWSTQYTFEQAVADSWKWQEMNPHGFNERPK